ncbi:ribose-phosphate diphosphokinase [Gemmatimonadota bacterium]
MPHDMKFFTGTSNSGLALEISEYLESPLGNVTISTFADGEIFVKFEENIRGADVFIIQSTNSPATNLIELFLMLDAARKSSARRVTAVIPYYGYCRQDRKDQPRVSISAKLMADLITMAGANRMLTMDLHAAQIQGFFDIPVDHLYSSMAFTEYFKALEIADLTVVAPDVGSLIMARAYAKRLGVKIAFIDKRRPEPNAVEVLNIIGEIEGRNILIIDDMVDTAGTLCAAAKGLKEQGANHIYCAATHGLLSGPAIERLEASPIEKMIVTNTISIPGEKQFPDLEIVSVGHIFGEAIRRTYQEESISTLFR